MRIQSIPSDQAFAICGFALVTTSGGAGGATAEGSIVLVTLQELTNAGAVASREGEFGNS